MTRSDPDLLNLQRDGARIYPGACLSILDHLHGALTDHDLGLPGSRIQGAGPLAALLEGSLSLGLILRELDVADYKPVRAVLFDKNPDANWSLGWHQDRTICVQTRHEVAGFGPWSIKQGLIHVEPPFSLIERMVTMRLHLDAVGDDNAPLLIAPGSHRRGRIAHDQIESVVAECGTYPCLAAAGDIWVYSTPIVHASARSVSPARRRVLQIDFSGDSLPEPLSWSGV